MLHRRAGRAISAHRKMESIMNELTSRLSVLFTPEQRALLKAKAEEAGVGESTYARLQVLKAIKEGE